VNSATNTVLHLDVEFRYDVGFEGSILLKILFRRCIDDISDGEALDSFIFRAKSATVDTDNVFNITSVIFVSAVVSSLDGHVVNYIRIYLLI
jgi:hypothetical protein